MWDAQWRKFFKNPALPLRTLAYEEFTLRYTETMRDALAFLGRKNSAPCEIPAPRHEKLADAKSQSWKERFLTEKADAK